MMLITYDNHYVRKAEDMEGMLSFDWVENLRSDEFDTDTGYGCVAYLFSGTHVPVNLIRLSHDYVGANARGKLML